MAIYFGGGTSYTAHGWTGSDDRDFEPDPDDRDDLDEADAEAADADDWTQAKLEEKE